MLYLPPECIRCDFISTYIKDYNIKMDNMKDEDKSFTLELQLLYHEKFTEIILQPESTIIITE
jgi:hypothetical protein